MGAWHKSSWYGSSWYDSTWYGGTGGGGASTASTGGGTSIDLSLPTGWREVTEKELRASARAGHVRRREARMAWLREGLRSPAPAKTPDATRAPERVQSPDVARLAESVLVGKDGPVDALTRMLARFDADRSAERERAAREAGELNDTARRATLGKRALSRRATVWTLGHRATVDAASIKR